MSTVLVVAVFGFFFPKLADYSDVWDTIRGLDATAIAALVGVATWNLFALVPVVMASQPGTRFNEAFVDMTAGTAFANTVPAGSAIGIGVNWAMFDSWGFTPAEYTLATLVSGVWNNFVKLSLPVAALVILALSGDLRSSFVPAAVVGVAVMAGAVIVFALILRSDRLARSIGRAVQRIAAAGGRLVGWSPDGDWGEGAVDFRHRSIDLVRRRWIVLTVAAFVGHLSLYLVLLVAVRAVGVSNAEVSWQEVLASFAFVRLLSAVPITPGGLGVVELGLTAALASGQSSAVTDQLAAAVLLYRALTYLLPIPVGAACYLFWRANRSWRRTPEERHRAFSRPTPP